jgi:hypothetical protein
MAADHAHEQGEQQEPAEGRKHALRPSGTRTQAVTEPLCTSRPAQRSTSVSISSPPPGTPASGRHPEEPLPGESQSRARGNSAGCPRLPRQTYQRARGTKQHQRRPDDRPISHPSRVPSTTIRGLSEIDGPAPCYSAFPLVVLLHKSYKDKGGINYGPRPPTARLQTTAIHFPASVMTQADALEAILSLLDGLLLDRERRPRPLACP